MMPAAIAGAADEHGWKEDQTISGPRGTWVMLRRGDVYIDVWYDRWRHSQGRAYRGRALTGIFTGQRQVIEYMAAA